MDSINSSFCRKFSVLLHITPNVDESQSAAKGFSQSPDDNRDDLRYENNVMCHCGKKGCIETEISGSAVCRKTVERIHNPEAAVLSKKVWSGNVITIEDIIEAAKLEDPLCIELETQAGSELGHQLTSLINLLNPDRIIIGGRMSEIASYYFLQPVKLAVHKYSLRLMTQHLSIVPSRLGVDAGVIGGLFDSTKKDDMEQIVDI